MSLEWQAAEGSRTLHLIDMSKPSPARSGPKAACGRRPQRNQTWWFGLPADRLDLTRPAPYDLTVCPECEQALTAAAAT